MNIGPATSSPSSMHHHQYGTSAPDMSRSTFPSSYYESFYANGTPAWSAYPAATYPSQASQAVTSAAGTCLLGPNGPKSLVNSHFSTVHSQRRKRRVLFTQAQVRYIYTHHPMRTQFALDYFRPLLNYYSSQTQTLIFNVSVRYLSWRGVSSSSVIFQRQSESTWLR